MRAMKGSIAIFLLVGSQIGFGQPSNSASRSFAGVDVILPIPKGYCLIERDDPLGALHYQLQDDGNQGRNIVAVLFADCAEWARKKTDNSYRVRKRGSYLFILPKGEEKLLPLTYTRQKLVQGLVESEMSKQTFSSSKMRDEITKYVDDKLKSARIQVPTLASELNMGIIGISDYAVFMGVAMKVNYPNESSRITSVAAITAVNRVLISMNLYADYSDTIFDVSLASQKLNIAALIAANH